MTSLEKIVHLATQSEYDCIGDEGKVFENIDLSKIDALGQGTKHDICTSSSTTRIADQNQVLGDVTGSGICHSFTANGRCVSMFKTLFTNYCTHDCKYCQNSTDYKGHKSVYSYTPE